MERSSASRCLLGPDAHASSPSTRRNQWREDGRGPSLREFGYWDSRITGGTAGTYIGDATSESVPGLWVYKPGDFVGLF